MLATMPSSLLRRHPANPLLGRADLGGADQVLVFNPGVVPFDDRLLMAARVDRTIDGRWGNHQVYATDLVLAWSDDGVTWDLEPEPVLDRAGAIELLQPLEPHRDLDRELWRIYDPRLVRLDEPGGSPRLVLSFAADTVHGLRAGLAWSDDARHWRPLALGPPDNRNQVLFPVLIDGRFVRLERPMNHYGGEALGAGRYGTWLSRSPDLVHWGDTRFLFDAAAFPFAGVPGFGGGKVGPGAPPVRTAAGWLCLVHVVGDHPRGGQRGWEPSWDKVYCAAAVLLDLDDPSLVLAASPDPLLWPEAPYETSGYRHDVVFPTGVVVRGSGSRSELWVYYGAADTSVALATVGVDEVLGALVPLPGPQPLS